MKKFTAILTSFLFLVFAIPLIVLGDIHGPNECCLLNHDLTSVDMACDTELIVGVRNPKWCDVDGDDTMTGAEQNPTFTQRWATCCFLDSIYTFSDWLFMAFFALTVIIIGIAAYFFLFSGGEPQKVSKAQNFLLYGVVAVVLVILSKVIPAVIKAIVA